MGLQSLPELCGPQEMNWLTGLNEPPEARPCHVLVCNAPDLHVVSIKFLHVGA